ncbi:hypothetical protein ABT294_43105 [Nonomuraea sp. NPDC000554]|uniref:hypothetical protein n=1 Tax=Nonomuraea sp. NPDC000554 TaxID=3154259 RepID=UPI0033257408
MSQPYVLPTLVRGPYPLAGRRLVVDVGWLAVVFRNGVPRLVCGPGRHGSVLGLLTGRRLPATGELSMLLFDTAPQNVQVAADDVRLADGRQVGVTAVAVVQPRWSAEPRMLLDIAARYGVLSSRYGEAAGFQLDADFRAWARTLLGERDHDAVYLAHDSRSALAGSPGSSVPGGGMLAVERFVHVIIDPDPVVTSIRTAGDEAEIEMARLVARTAIEPIGAALRAIRSRYRDAIARDHGVRQAALDVDLAALYGVVPLFMRDPTAGAEVEKARWQVLNGLLGEYADTIPFAAEALGVTPTELLKDLARGRVPGTEAAAAPPSPDEIGQLDDRRRPA